jgi:cardiolipin synthase (CMP-forming)
VPMTLPNLLTLARILAIPVVVALLYFATPVTAWAALAVYTVACVTDWFDGYLARAWKLTSAFGRALDPIADKLLVGAVLLVLVGTGVIYGLHLIAALIILLREILVSGLREVLAGTRVSLPVTQLARWKTGIQMVALGVLIVADRGASIIPYLRDLPIGTIGLGGLWIAGLLTLKTGYDYTAAGLRHLTSMNEPAGD